ncbi:MAG: hypothetical protein ACI93T_002293 [Porticoccaceae bacterium]
MVATARHLAGFARELKSCRQAEKAQFFCATSLPRDFKHFAANVLKKVVGDDDERFAEFTSQTGRTRSAIQQTELAHLSPAGQFELKMKDA